MTRVESPGSYQAARTLHEDAVLQHYNRILNTGRVIKATATRFILQIWTFLDRVYTTPLHLPPPIHEARQMRLFLRCRF